MDASARICTIRTAMSGSDLTFLYGESVPRCTHHIDKVSADYSTLQYMSAGGVELAVDGEVHQLRGPWFWSAYPGPRIRFHVAPGHRTWRHRYIAFRGKLIDRWRKAGLFPIAPQRPPKEADYAEPFDALLRNAIRSDRWSKLRAVNLLEAMLIDLAEARTQASTRDPWLERTIAR